MAYEYIRVEMPSDKIQCYTFGIYQLKNSELKITLLSRGGFKISPHN
jgi:hypothetical protein